MRTTIEIDNDLFKQLKNQSNERATSLRQICNDTMRRGLQDMKVREKPPPYHCPSFSMGSPAPGLDLNKALHIAASLEDGETARDLELRK